MAKGCKYRLKDSDQWFKSKEALATSLNVTPGLKEAVAKFENEVGKTDMESVTAWIEKNKTGNNVETNERRLAGSVGEGETTEQAQPVEGTGAETIGANRNVQSNEEVDFDSAPLSTIEEEIASEEEFDAAIAQVKELAPDLSEEDQDYAAFLVQNEVPIDEAIEYTRNTPDAQRIKPYEENANEKVASENNAEAGQTGVESFGGKPNEIFAATDTAIGKSGVEATAARREIKEKYGAEKTAKAIKITREFEKIISRLEAEGKIKKVCP